MEIEEGVTASTDNTLQDLQILNMHDTKAEFNNCFIIAKEATELRSKVDSAAEL